MRRVTDSRGQATVELVALLPVVVVVAVAVFAVLSAGSARERAAAAAHAGAIALLQERDAREAAVDALGDVRGRVDVDGSRITGRVAPRLPLPGLNQRLAATASADAGLERPALPAGELRGGDGDSADPRRADRAASPPATDPTDGP
jgi:hypothetical protein